MDPGGFNLIDLLMPLLRLSTPWAVMSVLSSFVAAAAFTLIAGRGLASLPLYLVLGMVVALFCQALASDLPPLPPPLSIGEVNLVVVSGATWAVLTIARLLRL